MTAMGSSEWDKRHAERDERWSGEPSRFLVAETATLAPGRALDLACGSGRHAVWLAARGWRVTGVDFSDVGLEAARLRAADRGVEVELVRADLLDYRPEEGAFDLVLVFYLQLPAEQRRIVLPAAVAALAPGGTLLIVGHDLANLTRGYGGPQNPAVLYSAADLVESVDGLDVERAEPVERPVATPEGERVAIDVLLRARRPT